MESQAHCISTEMIVTSPNELIQPLMKPLPSVQYTRIHGLAFPHRRRLNVVLYMRGVGCVGWLLLPYTLPSGIEMRGVANGITSTGCQFYSHFALHMNALSFVGHSRKYQRCNLLLF